MTVKYTISRDDLKKKNYKAGSRSEKGAGPAAYDYSLIRPIVLKMMTSCDK